MHGVRRTSLVFFGIAATLAASPACRVSRDNPSRLELREGWRLETSAKIADGGERLSTPGFPDGSWHSVTVPTTVVAALVADGTYPDPHFGTNLREIPGTTYPIGKNFSNVEMPPDSPFAVPWWYRTELELPASAQGRRIWLRLAGVNFKANIWMNGRRLADADQTSGSWRVHELDATEVARPGERNAVAVEVFAPRTNDLAITFVDWNPMPPDKVMGLFRPVSVSFTGPVALAHPMVTSKLNPPDLDRAELTVRVFARNASEEPVKGRLRGTIGGIAFEQEVALAGGEEREVTFAPGDFAPLVVADPELWWPHQYGEPVLHDLALEFEVGAGAVSDRASLRFGIREFTADIDERGHLLYRVNGRPILVRGAGWASEMTLRYSTRRYEQELAYVKDMGLNTVRLEGKLEDDAFFDIADREGLMVMPGWCCCHYWERWDEWEAKDLPIAVAQLRDQILRLRSHPSVFTWYNGSDGPPPAAVEKAYLEVEHELGFPNPVVSSATDKVAEFSGPSGVKMRGPYEWVPPAYWYEDTRHGGPHGFATEIGPGPAPPPLETLKTFLPADELWPVGEAWDYHCGGGEFKNLDVFDAAMNARYGRPGDVSDYARTAQLAAYESHRAMFESFGARKYVATGVIQWMLNNAWPGMIWHLYDYALRPGGSYFGTKKACEPLHVQYGYDDSSVVVVNSTLRDHSGLVATARVFDLASEEKLTRSESVDVPADGHVVAFDLPEVAGVSPVALVWLGLDDSSGHARSRSVYWLSAKPETLAWDQSKWYYTPVRQYADFTALRDLPEADIEAEVHFETAGADGLARLSLENPSKRVAFFVRLAVRAGEGGPEVLPVRWEDNYLSLAPGEARDLTARYAVADLGGKTPVLEIEGWNVPARTIR